MRVGGVATVARALAAAAAGGVLTPDRGGTARTSEVVRCVLAAVERATLAVVPVGAPLPTRPTGPHPPHAGDVVVVVDLQSEFCSPTGPYLLTGEADAGAVAGAVAGARALVRAASAVRVPVLWVRTLYDAASLPPVVAARLAARGRSPVLAPGTGTGAFYGVAPSPREAVVSKRAHSGFDGTTLEAALAATGAARVVLAGLFTDVCVAATALGAHARGLGVAVAADATAPLDAAPRDALAYLQKYCAAHVACVADLAAGWGGGAPPPTVWRGCCLEARRGGCAGVRRAPA